MAPRLALVAGALVFLGLVLPGSASYLTDSKFPWEGCAQQVAESVYTADFDSYYPRANGEGWTMCWRVKVKNMTECQRINRRSNGTPRTRCCNTDFNKFRVWANYQCRNRSVNAVDSVILDGVQMSRFTWDDFSDTSAIGQGAEPGTGTVWALKMTPLSLTPQTANGYQICINLQPPCETMEKFAANGEVVEFALYDIKKDNYECCPVGYTYVMNQQFGPGADPPNRLLGERSPPPPKQPPPPKAAPPGKKWGNAKWKRPRPPPKQAPAKIAGGGK